MSLFQNLVPAFGRSVARRDDTTTETVPTVKPAYQVKETADAFSVTVYLPGVAKDGLEITAEDGELRITGRRGWARPEGWVSLHRETSDAGYQLVLTHDNAIDAGKIAAELTNGVLRVTLPKAEALKPRKIAVS